MSQRPTHPLLPVLEEIPYQQGRTFLHRVDSDQWKELGIHKNDRLLLEFRPLKNGDLAMVLHHGQALLTRYSHLPRPTFHPPTPSKALPVDDAVLQGVVTCIVRTL